jgi:hypothetical protein
VDNPAEASWNRLVAAIATVFETTPRMETSLATCRENWPSTRSRFHARTGLAPVGWQHGRPAPVCGPDGTSVPGLHAFNRLGTAPPS